jgi:CRP-like cAMP-binding protein
MRYIGGRLPLPSDPPPPDKDLQTIRRETFAQTPLFSALTPEERGQLAAFASPHRFSAGETLFFEGDPCPGLWVIGSGTVKITKTSPAGREIMLAVESAPSSVAEVPLFDGGGYPANVTALRDTLAFLLHKDDFRRFCEEHPQVPLKVLAVVGKRLRALVQLIETVTFGSVRQRLARVLLQAAENHPANEPLEIPITHEELAARLGTVREVVSRNLSRFQAEGLVKVVKRQVVIIDAGALRAEADTEF